MIDAVSTFLSTHGHWVPTLVFVWLAVFFGRTLRPGAMPLIERVARVGKPDLSAVLCRYTRGLTLAWSVYFVLAAVLSVAMQAGFREASLGVALASLLLFVGEHYLRRFVLFRHEWFPDLLQQLRDTVQVWRPQRPLRS